MMVIFTITVVGILLLSVFYYKRDIKDHFGDELKKREEEKERDLEERRKWKPDRSKFFVGEKSSK